MRNDISEKIDCWHYLNAVNDKETINFLENTFELQNKNNIIDIQDGVMVINNERWVAEEIYNKSLDLFNICKEAGYPMRDTDILLSLLILDTPKSFYKHLGLGWNWYYEQPQYESFGGENAKILHSVWSKPWYFNDKNINKNLKRAYNVWNKIKK